MKSMTVFPVMTVMTMMASTTLNGASTDPTEDHRVTVCIDGGGLSAVTLAQMITSEMFRAIGVRIVWHPGTFSCPSDGIIISLSYRTPSNLMPTALAYAKPFEGIHIVVFYDRIVDMYGRSRVALVLGHVLVHEMTHILESIERHSERGVMKAHWSSADLVQMSRKRLGFEGEDIELIRMGMAARVRRAMLAGGAAQQR